MHELTVVENIMRISEATAQENQLSKISCINLEVGRMQHLNEEIMKHGFDAARKGTIMKEAEIRLEWLPIRLQCNECAGEFKPRDGRFYCPYCGSSDTNIIQGLELQIKSIEGE